jgi:glycosyltransferase involved in cell wall biosynthesis
VVATEVVPYSRRLAALIERERADVVHFNTARGAIMAGLGAHLAGVDVVLHVRGTPAIGRLQWTVAQALSARLILVARALERCVAPSVRPRARVVYNGVEARADVAPEVARAHAATAGVPPSWLDGSQPLFLALSSLVPFKGLHHLIRAVRELADRGVEGRFVLAGTGLGDAYETWLRALPEQLGVADRVAFIGFVDDVHPLLQACDALVLPSVEREELEIAGRVARVHGNEGLPRSVLDAMAAGRPAVASDIAGVREQIDDGIDGLVVPPGDPSALADAIERLVRDRSLRVAAGAAGREKVAQRFTVAGAAAGLTATLAEAAASRPMSARAADALRAALDSARRTAIAPSSRS